MTDIILQCGFFLNPGMLLLHCIWDEKLSQSDAFPDFLIL